MGSWCRDLYRALSTRGTVSALADELAETIGTASVMTASLSSIRGRERAKRQRMIILPAEGLRAPRNSTMAMAARTFLPSLVVGAVAEPAAAGVSASIRVLDAVHEDGAKLVEMAPDDVTALRAVHPGLRVVPEVFYQPAVHVPFARQRPKPTAARTRSVTIRVTSKGDRRPVKDVFVVAFTNFASREGAQGVTSASGTLTLALPSSIRRLERVYAFPDTGHWGALKRNVDATEPVAVSLTPLDLSFVDCVRHHYGRAGGGDGTGVRVAVIDSGVELDHPDLPVSGGECTIPGQPPGSFGPLGGPHGTHVAGIIGARGSTPSGVRGVAPGCTLYSYRVFNAGQGASSFSIIKAIDRAVAQGCDLINLSLGGGPRDPAMESAVSDAYLAGAVCIVAAGNDGRRPVAVPAAYQLCVAVSANGRKGTFPAGTTEAGDVAAPYGEDRHDFVAAFTNVGVEIDVTGPGVGVISTMPGGAHGVMSGTSMACPAVSGLAARLLSDRANAGILAGDRDESRSNAIVQLLLQSCRTLGFGKDFEGLGLPRA